MDTNTSAETTTPSVWASPLWQRQALVPLLEQLEQIRSDMLDLEERARALWQDLPPERQDSARNLLHYVALRRHDIRDLQEQLVQRGLSSLGRCESYVMANVEMVLGILREASGAEVATLPPEKIPADFAHGRHLLEAHTDALLGEQPDNTEPTIMVTMPSEAADDYALVHDLLASGMSVMRINGAHDDCRAWGAMIKNLRRAEQQLGRTCRVAMDLAGPKIRTGPIEPGPQVIKWKPHRDPYGQVTAPARVWLTPQEVANVPHGADAAVSVSGDWWQQVEVGDVLELTDASGRRRQMEVMQTTDEGIWIEGDRTARITPETLIHRVGSRTRDDELPDVTGGFGPIPPQENFIVLHQGDRLLLTEPTMLGKPAQHDEHGALIHAASIGCTLPEIFRDVRAGERILFDDGKIGGVVREADENHLLVEITRARSQGDKLRADKGINLPDTDLKLPALTEKDIEDLDFVVHQADIVSYSFVRRAEDIRQLYEHLKRLDCPGLAVVLKIENRQAFENLPTLLLEAMHSPAAGVMIARGDLAVECGWERLAELQEEILWVCEAAHMPVIWATQVLEDLAKKGLPTRAEVTDAAMGARAECVMLNKGPNIVETVRSLSDILRRMQEHQVKKRSTFRRLQMADRLIAE